MKTIKVRITNTNYETVWYKEMEGQVFEVFDKIELEGLNAHYVLTKKEGLGEGIYVSDCEIVTETINKHPVPTEENWAPISQLNNDIKYQRLVGEFTGTLEGILFWDIPSALKDKLQDKINKLKQI
jgi:hypothetical protein